MRHGFYPGRRLSYEGNTCTVRYVGPVRGTKGEWLGVEWDDPARGKHNGQHDGVKYFDCRSCFSNPASFVRPSRPHDTPRNFVEAVRAKYASEETAGSQMRNRAAKEVITISGKDVEEVGFDKIRRQLANLKALRIVVLDGLCIGAPRQSTGNDEVMDTPNEITELARETEEICPNIHDLDLSRNLFESLREIFSIVNYLLGLKSLNISGNRLSDTEIKNEFLGQELEYKEELFRQYPFATLRTLGLEQCLLTWEEIADISTCFPILSSLAVGSNELRWLSDHSLPLRLTQISLDRNMFEYIAQLRPLMNLEKLERLNLKGNRIHGIHDRSITDKTSVRNLVFSHSMHDLDLSYNEISSWQFIDELASVFPGLKSLRTSANPLFDRYDEVKDTKQNAGEGYVLTIAHIANLETLNFSQITKKDRRDAEAFYLSQIGRELSSTPIENAPDILAGHPRYAELCATLGEPVIVRKEISTVDDKSLAARMIRFTFEVDGTAKASARTASAAPETDIWEVKIPESFTVNNVLGMVGKYFGLMPMLLKLVWETGEEENPHEFNGSSDITPIVEQKSSKTLREEILQPRTRRIGTWFEGRSGKIRVELSEEDFNRRQAALKSMLFE